MRKNWENPEIKTLNISETADADKEMPDGDGVYLGWLGREGGDCTDICS